MRVIAGSAKRIQLITVEGLDTRPTQDRVKETLFNMMQYDLYGCNFLDLFSGSGGIGIEALSRGAECAYFVENNDNAIRCIKENLLKTKLGSKATVLKSDALSSLNRLDGTIKFDFIFMDPPYNQGHEMEILKMIANSSILNENGIIIIEASLETNFDYVEDLGFEIIKEKKYKTNKHVFVER